MPDLCHYSKINKPKYFFLETFFFIWQKHVKYVQIWTTTYNNELLNELLKVYSIKKAFQCFHLI